MKKVKILSALLVCAVSLGIVSGCGSKTNDSLKTASSSTNTATATPKESSERIKFTILIDGAAYTAQEDLIKEELNKAINADIQLEFTPGGQDYTSIVNTRIAGGSVPDVFNLPSRAMMSQYVSNGVLLDLTPYKDKLKQTLDFIGADSELKGYSKDKMYAISKAPNVNYNSLLVRKDWMDALGLKEPSTLEEFYNMCKTFAEKDPDGNGKKDTYALTGMKLPTFTSIFAAYGVSASRDVIIKDGKVTSSIYQPAIKDAIKMAKKFVEEGLVDPDFMINDPDKLRDKAIQGKVAIQMHAWSGMLKPEFMQKAIAANPKAEWAQIGALTGPGGKYACTYDLGSSSGQFGINANLSKNTDKLDKIFELFNYVSSKEGNTLVAYGIKDRHHVVKDGKITPTELMGKEIPYVWYFQLTGRPEMEYLKTKFPKNAEQIDFAAKLPLLNNYNGFIETPEGVNIADIDKYIMEEFVKFIYGKRDIADYDNFVNTLNSMYNYQKYIDSAAEQLKSLGYIK